MKLFLFPINDQDLKCFTEIFPAVPLLSEEQYKIVLNHANTWNEGLFTKLRLTDIRSIYVQTIEECDIAIIPFKYDKNDSRIQEYCNIANLNNKKVIGFYNDDSGESFILPNNLYLYRTSLNQFTKHINERVFPVIVPDHFPSYKNLTELPSNKIITFCGHVGNGRLPIIQKVESVYDNTNFIYRSGFWAPELQSKQIARISFYENLLSGSFTLCMRGNGNFSYRFYEALSFGRIPILINTECILPFHKQINWDEHIICINKQDIHNIPELISQCKISPKHNRNLWMTYFSSEGYFNTFIGDL